MKNKLITFIFITTVLIFSGCQKEPIASFTVSSSSVNIGENVTFTNTSLDANSFLWDFGDGETSITQSPSHTYNTAGTYTVTLTAFSKNVNKKDIATNEIIVSPLKPTVTTSSVNSVTQTSAVCGGNVISDGGTTVTARGVCWSTSQNPTINDSHTTDGTGTGSFTSSITNLSVGITYYVRAYATNSAGTDYGNQISFKTNPSTYPTVNTSSVSNVTQTTATCGGNVTSNGGATVTGRGVCWSTSQNPTTSNNHTTNGSGTGAFTSSVTGLSVGTTYYVKAYATNSAGTDYGNLISFTTNQALLPTVSTSSINNVTYNSATCGGNVTSDGGTNVTARGVCWSTSQNPTTSNSYTTNGNGTGSFISSITGLTANTTYYIRAYATNNVGTAYGNEQNFTTDITGQTGTLTDYDGNTYNWVGIGKQAWMAENLKVTHYSDGTEILLVTDNTAWANLCDNNIDDAYCYYNNESTSQYGALYTWAAAMGDNAVSSSANPSGVQGVCPDGWHLPSDAEWTELINYIANDGHSGAEGTALKATSGWYSEGNGTDDYGFSALPGGYRSYYDGTFNNVGYYGAWWSGSESNSYAYRSGLQYIYADVSRYSIPKSTGLSVRCVRDY